jgi:hypothetical protein
MSKIYISYLKEDFDKNKMIIPKDMNQWISKPAGGFWGSPEDAEYGWKDFCADWKDLSKTIPFRFTLIDNAKILVIEELDDINKLNYCKSNDWDDKLYIDFNSIRDKYDGIELKDPSIGHRFLFGNKYKDIQRKEECFNSWDCESIVIWNPDIIIPMEV